MKRLLPYILLIPAVTFSCSSPAGVEDFSKMRKKADDSILTEEQRENTFYNASFVAFREQFSENRDFIDIPDERTDFFYDALVTILISEAGKEYEIIQEMKVQSFFDLTSILAYPEPDAPFIESWKASVVETGIEGIDTLLVDRGFEMGKTFDWPASDGTAYVLDTDVPLNTWRASQLLEDTGYFRYAESYSETGDGDDVRIEEIKTQSGKTLKVSFAYGYGDCAAGCLYEDHYVFYVYQNGDVEFVEKIVKA